MSTENSTDAPVAFFFGLACGLLVGLSMLFVGCIIASDTQKEKAIQAGVAEWTIDAKTGIKEFKYKGCK